MTRWSLVTDPRFHLAAVALAVGMVWSNPRIARLAGDVEARAGEALNRVGLEVGETLGVLPPRHRRNPVSGILVSRADGWHHDPERRNAR